MKQAIIAIEDRRFYTNTGIDLRGIGARAVPGHPRAEGRPGRLDDHDAVRQDRARRRRTSARSSRSSARPRSPTRSRASGPRSGSCATTSTRSTSATAPTASSRPRARTSATTTPAAASDGPAALRPGARAGARRRCSPAWSPRRAPTTRSRTARPRASAARSCSSAWSSRATSRRAQQQEALLDLAADQQGHPAAGRGHALPVLHLLGQAAGRRQARRRPGGRAAGVRGRPDGPDDARLAAAGGRRAGGRGVAALRGRPARLARRDQERHRRGARDGRRRRLRDRAVQPRHPGPAPARLGVQAVRARRRRCGSGISPDSTWASRKMSHCVTRKKGKCIEAFEVNNYEDAYAGVRTLRTRDDVLRQLRLRPGRHQGRHAQDRAARAPDGHPHARLAQPRDDARRPEPGRHAARHGARVRDLRPPRPVHLRLDEPGRRRPHASSACRRPARSGSARSAGPTTARSSRSRCPTARRPRTRRATGRC